MDQEGGGGCQSLGEGQIVICCHPSHRQDKKSTYLYVQVSRISVVGLFYLAKFPSSVAVSR